MFALTQYFRTMQECCEDDGQCTMVVPAFCVEVSRLQYPLAGSQLCALQLDALTETMRTCTIVSNK